MTQSKCNRDTRSSPTVRARRSLRWKLRRKISDASSRASSCTNHPASSKSLPRPARTAPQRTLRTPDAPRLASRRANASPILSGLLRPPSGTLGRPSSGCARRMSRTFFSELPPDRESSPPASGLTLPLRSPEHSSLSNRRILRPPTVCIFPKLLLNLFVAGAGAPERHSALTDAAPARPETPCARLVGNHAS